MAKKDAIKTSVFFLLILIFVSVGNTSAMTLSEFEKLSRAEAKRKAREQLAKESSDNSTTMELLLEREMRDFNKLKSMYLSMSEAEKKILERLLKDYDCWFSTILILYEEETQEMEALKEK